MFGPSCFPGCLNNLLDRGTRSEIKCPLCNQITPVSGHSVTNLPKNFPLMSLIGMPGRPQETYMQLPPKCSEHDDYLRRYCLKDGTLICSSCELYGSHQGHPTQLLDEAALAERKQLGELSSEVVRQKQKMQVALTKVEGQCVAVQETGGRMEDEVDEFFQSLIGLLQEEKQRVKTEIRKRTQLRVIALMKQAR